MAENQMCLFYMVKTSNKPTKTDKKGHDGLYLDEIVFLEADDIIQLAEQLKEEKKNNDSKRFKEQSSKS